MEEAGVVEVDWWRRTSGAGAGGGVGHQSQRQAGRWSRPVELAERHRWRRPSGAGAGVESGAGASGGGWRVGRSPVEEACRWRSLVD
jgi:hypothetical protein